MVKTPTIYEKTIIFLRAIISIESLGKKELLKIVSPYLEAYSYLNIVMLVKMELRIIVSNILKDIKGIKIVIKWLKTLISKRKHRLVNLVCLNYIECCNF